jgi:thiamine-phosphate pyrophosphorylase
MAAGERPERMLRWREPSLMLVTDRERLRGRPLEEVISQAVDGGVTAVQLREKDCAGGELYDMAVTLRHVLRGRALLLINDRVDIAIAAGADGVHLPEHSIPLRDVRALAGASCIAGRPVHSVDGAADALETDIDYLIAGTVFRTASKSGLHPAGVGLISAIAQDARAPIVAIGGITYANAASVIQAGADGVAVIGAILDAESPFDAARGLRAAIDEAYEVVA